MKSGIPAEMPKYLRPRKWPHFMEKKHKPKEQIYVSEKILGQLYDKVESVEFIPHYESPFDKRILRAYPEDRATLKTARQIKSQYDTAMRRIMAQHDIETEFEIWTSFVLSKPRVGSDYKVQEEMGIISSTLKVRFKGICIEAAGGDDFKSLGPFAAAMYQVTCEELAIALHECRTMKTIGGRDVPKRKMEPKSMPLMSFPWIFQSVLGRIATGSEPTTLEDVGLSFVTRNEARAKKPRLTMSDEDDLEDYIETADGVTHRGELLDLFRPDAVDSDGDGVILPYNIPDAASQVQDEPQLKYDLDETLDVDKEINTKGERGIITATNGLSESVTPTNVVKKYRTTLTLRNLVNMSGSKSSDTVALNVAMNKTTVAANSLIDISEPQTVPVQEASNTPSSNGTSESRSSMVSLPSRDLEGLEYITEIAANVPLPEVRSEGDFSQKSNTSLNSYDDTDTPQASPPNAPFATVDFLANFFDGNNTKGELQEELLSISETTERSRVSSHCEDLADLGAHCHDLADLDGECGGSDDGGNTLIQDEVAMDLAGLLFAATQESADNEPESQQISVANEQEPQQSSLALIEETSILAAAEELLVDISSATIQGDNNDADEDGYGSDYGEEVTLDIEESALEKLQKLSGGA